MLEPSGASVVSIDRPRIPALAQFLLQSSHLSFQAFDTIERIVEAGGLQRLQEGPEGREGATNYPRLWDRMARCVRHQKLLIGERRPGTSAASGAREPRLAIVVATLLAVNILYRSVQNR